MNNIDVIFALMLILAAGLVLAYAHNLLPDNNITKNTYYDNGNLESVTKYYDNGNLKSITKYYESGNINQVREYNINKLIKLDVLYYDNENLGLESMYQYYYNGGVKSYVEYDTSGNITYDIYYDQNGNLILAPVPVAPVPVAPVPVAPVPVAPVPVAPVPVEPIILTFPFEFDSGMVTDGCKVVFLGYVERESYNERIKYSSFIKVTNNGDDEQSCSINELYGNGERLTSIYAETENGLKLNAKMRNVWNYGVSNQIYPGDSSEHYEFGSFELKEDDSVKRIVMNFSKGYSKYFEFKTLECTQFC